MNCNYRIIKELNLVLRYYSGKLTLEDLYNYIELTGNDKDYLPSMNAINDIRNSQILFEEDDIIRFVNKVKENKRIYDKRKIVFLTGTPNQVVFSFMVNFFKKEPYIDLFIVSTVERAISNLLIPESNVKSIEIVIEELKKLKRSC